MNARVLTALLAAVIAAAACDTAPEAGDPGAGATSADPAQDAAAEPAAGESAKVGGPVSVTYRLVGTPVVGQPLAIDLSVTSALDGQPVRIDYRILDASALRLAESQSPFATVAASAGDAAGRTQVTVIPLREGRLYLNVAATVEAGGGTLSTVTAVPIQVGTASRALEENGSLETDPDGESVRVLEGTQN